MDENGDIAGAEGSEKGIGDGGGGEKDDACSSTKEGLQALNVDEGRASVVVVGGVEDIRKR